MSKTKDELIAENKALKAQLAELADELEAARLAADEAENESQALKDEIEELKAAPPPDDSQAARIAELELENEILKERKKSISEAPAEYRVSHRNRQKIHRFTINGSPVVKKNGDMLDPDVAAFAMANVPSMEIEAI